MDCGKISLNDGDAPTDIILTESWIQTEATPASMQPPRKRQKCLLERRKVQLST